MQQVSPAGEFLGKIKLQFEWIEIVNAVCIHSFLPNKENSVLELKTEIGELNGLLQASLDVQHDLHD
jgi:hypothetical protein